jgi:hypothetical protein
MELGHKEIARNGDIVPVAAPSAPSSAPKSPRSGSSSATLSTIEDSLRHLFGTQVKVKMKSNESGSFEIDFYSLEELERLLELMMSLHQQGE